MARLAIATSQIGIPAVGPSSAASGLASGRALRLANGGAPATGFAENPSLGLDGGWGMEISPSNRSGFRGRAGEGRFLPSRLHKAEKNSAQFNPPTRLSTLRQPVLLG